MLKLHGSWRAIIAIVVTSLAAGIFCYCFAAEDDSKTPKAPPLPEDAITGDVVVHPGARVILEGAKDEGDMAAQMGVENFGFAPSATVDERPPDGPILLPPGDTDTDTDADADIDYDTDVDHDTDRDLDKDIDKDTDVDTDNEVIIVRPPLPPPPPKPPKPPKPPVVLPPPIIDIDIDNDNDSP